MLQDCCSKVAREETSGEYVLSQELNKRRIEMSTGQALGCIPSKPTREETSGEYVLSQVSRLRAQCHDILAKAEVKLKGIAFEPTSIPKEAEVGGVRALPPFLETVNNQTKEMRATLNEVENLLDRIDL